MRYTVDACVLRASGSSTDRVASACRDVLLALNKTRSKIVFCAALRVEWDRHRSKFGASWLASMLSKGLLLKVKLDESHINGIKRAICSLQEHEVPHALKDIHLVAAAVEFRSVVVSLERNCREKYHGIVMLYPPLGNVIWMNPFRHQESAVACVMGDPMPVAWQLRFVDSD